MPVVHTPACRASHRSESCRTYLGKQVSGRLRLFASEVDCIQQYL